MHARPGIFGGASDGLGEEHREHHTVLCILVVYDQITCMDRKWI